MISVVDNVAPVKIGLTSQDEHRSHPDSVALVVLLSGNTANSIYRMFIIDCI